MERCFGEKVDHFSSTFTNNQVKYYMSFTFKLGKNKGNKNVLKFSEMGTEEQVINTIKILYQ